MSPIFQVIPDEAKSVKQTARVIEPLQVIPEDEELELKAEHVSKSEHPNRSRHATTLSMHRRLPATIVHRPSSESFNRCVYQFPFIHFPKPSRNEIFNPTSCLVARNSAKSRKSPDPLVQKRRRMYPHGGFQAILESPMERFPSLSPCPEEECAHAA